MTRELLNEIKNLIALKNAKVVEVINWCWKDGSGNYYYILTDNGTVYDFHTVGGYLGGYGNARKRLEKRYSIAKISNKDYKTVIAENETIIKERVKEG